VIFLLEYAGGLWGVCGWIGRKSDTGTGSFFKHRDNEPTSTAAACGGTNEQNYRSIWTGSHSLRNTRDSLFKSRNVCHYCSINRLVGVCPGARIFGGRYCRLLYVDISPAPRRVHTVQYVQGREDRGSFQKGESPARQGTRLSCRLHLLSLSFFVVLYVQQQELDHKRRATCPFRYA